MGRASARKKLQIVDAPLRLDLGCGQNKRDGFHGVDKFAVTGVDTVHDLLAVPWPWADGSVSEVHCSHFFEHIPGPLRGAWMDELYRVLTPGRYEGGKPVAGFATILVPYAQSHRAVQDFSHAWPPVHEVSFLYFNKHWREENKLTHGVYALTCDFDFTYGYHWDANWQVRSDEAKAFAARHYDNVITDLGVTLVKRA